jgi:hypothetical protein
MLRKHFVIVISSPVFWAIFGFFDFPRRTLQLSYSIGGFKGSAFGPPNLILLKPNHDVADIRLGGDKSLFLFAGTISDRAQCPVLHWEFG